MRKTIKLEAVDPVEIYGAGNKILEEFCSYENRFSWTGRRRKWRSSR